LQEQVQSSTNRTTISNCKTCYLYRIWACLHAWP